MRKPSLFSRERSVYWPEEFADVVNLLTGKDSEGKSVFPSLYGYNTGAIALASAVGVRNQRKKDIGSDGRKEISTSTFAAHGLEPYIFLVPLIGKAEIDILRIENEELLIREFEKYVAGGLEILRGEIEESGGGQIEVVIQKLLMQAGTNDKTETEDEVPNIDLI